MTGRETWLDAANCRPGTEVVVWVSDGTRVGLATCQYRRWHMVDPAAPPMDPVTHWAYIRQPAAPAPLRLVRT